MKTGSYNYNKKGRLAVSLNPALNDLYTLDKTLVFCRPSAVLHDDLAGDIAGRVRSQKHG